MTTSNTIKKMVGKTVLTAGLALAGLAFATGTAQAFNPQPEPPGKPMFVPQPDPPGKPLFVPQPDIPGLVNHASVVWNGGVGDHK
jgi:hypothetical protein